MSNPAYAPLRKTKISAPPLRDRSIPRPQLFERLTSESKRPLTLISAPAGFGKTTALTGWLRASENQARAAWLSLDDDDNDPVRLFYYIVATLQKVEPGIGRALISLFGFLQTPAARDLMTLLLNDIAETGKEVVLVLDDYHVIRNPEIDTAIAFLVDHAPENLHLILSTRQEPALPLARWRSTQRVAEIDLGDLRFTSSEAALFLRETMGLQLSKQTVNVLEMRTEGWIAGLQMAALSLQHHDRSEGDIDEVRIAGKFGGEHYYVIDYLAAEVMRRQPPEIAAFLRQTAILDRLCPSLCDAVTQREDSKAMLARLEQANLFLLRLDDQRRWFRYHPVFAQFLRSEIDAADAKTLHRRASAWFERNDLQAEAFKHAMGAQDVASAVRLFRGAVDGLCRRGEFPTALAWLDSLPESTVRSLSDLAGYKAWLLYLGGRLDEAKSYSAMAISTKGDKAPATHRGILLAFEAFLAINRGEPTRAIPLARKALDELGDSESFFRACALCLFGHAQRFSRQPAAAIATLQEAIALGRKLGSDLIAVDALGSLAPLMLAQGQLREAIRLCQEAVERHIDARGKPLPIAGLVYVQLGALRYETDELETARQCLALGIDLCRQLGMVYYALTGMRALARVQHAKGEFDSAWNTIAEANTLASGSENPQHRRSVAVLTAELQLRESNVAGAARTFAEISEMPGSATDRENLVHARLLLEQNDARSASAILERAKNAATKGAFKGNLIPIHVLQALCKRAQGQRTAAVREVEAALSLASSAGFRRVFLDAGPALASLLEPAAQAAPAFVHSLMGDPQFALKPTVELPPLLSALSKTQVEIVRYLNRGAKNQEIADKLAITLGTTKWHLNQIFSKLQVRNRTGAVAKARELGIV